MKTFKNLMLLAVVASLLSSCIVQDRGYRHYRHGYGGGYWHRGY